MSQEEQDNLAWDSLGERQLAKDWGAKILYRIRYKHESPDLPTFEDDAAEAEVENRVKKGIELCRRLLSMGNENQKLAALDNLASIPHAESISILLSYALKKEETERVRHMAVASLAEMNNRTIVPELLQVAISKDEPPSIKSAAVIALGELGDRRAFEPLAKLASGKESADLDPHLRLAALQAIARLDGERAAPVISESLEQADPMMIGGIIGAAGLAASKGCSVALAKVASQKESYDPRTRGSAIEAILLAGVGPVPNILPIIAELAKDINESPRVRVPAIGLLALYETPEARAALEKIAGRLDDDYSPLALKALFGGEDFARRQIEKFKERLDL